MRRTHQKCRNTAEAHEHLKSALVQDLLRAPTLCKLEPNMKLGLDFETPQKLEYDGWLSKQEFLANVRITASGKLCTSPKEIANQLWWHIYYGAPSSHTWCLKPYKQYVTMEWFKRHGVGQQDVSLTLQWSE